MNLPAKFKVKSESDTADLAKDFLAVVKQGDVVGLIGNLGSGKTFFVKKFCENIGINNVSSPTFAIVNEYKGKAKIFHFDFFRVKKPLELIDIGFYDYLNDKDAINFIEWADMFPEVLPHKRYEIKFNLLEDFSREISITKYE